MENSKLKDGVSMFDNGEFEKYSREAKEKWGQTDAYKEFSKKAEGYTKDDRQALMGEMSDIMARFSKCMKSGASPDSPEARELVKILQNHITENYYNCTNEILSGLGKMYVADERFKKNIDKNGAGTAEFISRAIESCLG